MTINQNIVLGSVYGLYEFARTAMMRCCALSGYHHRNLCAHCQSQRLMYWHLRYLWDSPLLFGLEDSLLLLLSNFLFL